MVSDPVEEGREKAQGRTLEALTRARNLLSELVQDDEKVRKAGLIWRVYFEVELAIGLGKFLVRDSDKKVGKFRNVVVSKNNDPRLMPLNILKERLASIDSDLEYAEYDFEISPSEQGLESARKARDELKKLILGGGKKSREKTTRSGV